MKTFKSILLILLANYGLSAMAATPPYNVLVHGNGSSTQGCQYAEEEAEREISDQLQSEAQECRENGGEASWFGSSSCMPCRQECDNNGRRPFCVYYVECSQDLDCR